MTKHWFRRVIGRAWSACRPWGRLRDQIAARDANMLTALLAIQSRDAELLTALRALDVYGDTIAGAHPKHQMAIAFVGRVDEALQLLATTRELRAVEVAIDQLSARSTAEHKALIVEIDRKLGALRSELNSNRSGLRQNEVGHKGVARRHARKVARPKRRRAKPR